jgi:hypothetical protein
VLVKDPVGLVAAFSDARREGQWLARMMNYRSQISVQKP